MNKIIQMGNRIQKVLNERGMNIKDLSKKTNINYNTLRGFITSGNTISLEKLFIIIDYLGITFSYVAGETNSPTSNKKDLYLSVLNEFNQVLEKVYNDTNA